MALQLFRLVLSGTTTTTAKPTITNYWHKPATQITSGAYTITKANWLNSNNSAPTTLVNATTSNGYYLLNIDGVLQTTNLITAITSNLVTITVPAGGVIRASAPISLTVTNFAPSSATTVTG